MAKANRVDLDSAMLFHKKAQLATVVSKWAGARCQGKGTHILMYHSIGDPVEGDVNNIYSLDASLFRAQISYLSNCDDLSIVSFCDWDMSDRGLAITFDDGFLNTLTVAAKVLDEHRFPFTVFVSPAKVISNESLFLDRGALVELSTVNGCTIGAHGFSHVALTKCEPKALTQELQDSKRWLEDLLSVPVNTMSYPHGKVNNRVRNVANISGYQLAASSQPGGNTKQTDPLRLKRTEIWSTDHIDVFQDKVYGSWDWMKWLP